MNIFMRIFVLLGFGIVFFGCGSPNIGLTKNGLHPCPGRPNCVSSQSMDAGHLIDPLSYRSGRENAHAGIQRVIARMDNARIITQTPDYLHVEFRSQVMQFVDDVEFWLPKDKPLIHIRSASRLGYSDLGVNRKRTETIRSLFNKEQ